MTSIQLYINGMPADTGPDFKIRLNRQLISPGELNTKDAQYSYSISLPDTKVNKKIFNYAIVEETKDKFNRTYSAELIVNSIRVFVGLIDLTDIGGDGYKGNLYVPVYKSVSDIFGDIALNQNPPFLLPFGDFVTYVNAYNVAAATTPQAAIFPLVLYGLLPKVSAPDGSFSARDVWDTSVRFGLSDIPPSINPLLMIKHIFASNGLNINGSAFDDARLTQLYQSYKNADSYVQPWNYGQQGRVYVSGSWCSQFNRRKPDGSPREYERGVYAGNDLSGETTYAVDLLDATNTYLSVDQDPGGHVSNNIVEDTDSVPWLRGQIRVPASGLYKVQLRADFMVLQVSDFRHTDPATGVQHLGALTDHAANTFYKCLYEFKILRDRKTGDFGLNSAKLDSTFYEDNQPQNKTFDGDNIPKYFPQLVDPGSGALSQINMVDALQNDKIIMGFAWGRVSDTSGSNPLAPIPNTFQNPQDSPGDLDAGVIAQVLAAKPALPYDGSGTSEDLTRLAIKSPGYLKYGRIGDFDSEGDNPNADIDYMDTGDIINNKILDAQGNPVDGPAGNLDVQIDGYYLSALTGFPTPDADWRISDFIDLLRWQDLLLSGQYDGTATTVAITAFYDVNKQFIGTGILSPAVGITDNYVNEPVVLPTEAAYVRVSGQTLYDFVVGATDTISTNLILLRFPLERHFSYVATAPVGSNYVGRVFLHAGTDTPASVIVPFIDGVASFNTESFGDVGGDPRLTIYLKTAAFDVTGTLTLSRQIAEGSEDVIDWETTEKYKIDLINAPVTQARRGYYNASIEDNMYYGDGYANCVVYLEAGELITLAAISSEGKYRQSGMHSTFGWTGQNILFDFRLDPFRIDLDWLKVNAAGNGTGTMDWNDSGNFGRTNIDLVKFLSADVKTDEYLNDFCKAFNLNLSQVSQTEFRLDVKQSTTAISNRSINLDKFASVRDRANSPLGLPFGYKIGFTVDTDEEGYIETSDDGGGTFYTGAKGTDIVEQKSAFSFNWMKDISQGAVIVSFANITKGEAWSTETPYQTAQLKRYTDQGYRFWYYAGLLQSIGGDLTFNGAQLKAALVKNGIPGLSILNYQDRPFTINTNFFRLLISGASHYTVLSGYLTALEYQQLNGSIYAEFNGDIYFVAELSAYDPGALNETTIKLIRKI